MSLITSIGSFASKIGPYQQPHSMETWGRYPPVIFGKGSLGSPVRLEKRLQIVFHQEKKARGIETGPAVAIDAEVTHRDPRSDLGQCLIMPSSDRQRPIIFGQMQPAEVLQGGRVIDSPDLGKILLQGRPAVAVERLPDTDLEISRLDERCCTVKTYLKGWIVLLPLAFLDCVLKTGKLQPGLARMCIHRT